MARKYSTQSTTTRDREPPRNYVDFEDKSESEAAVERWLTPPASNSNTRSSNNINERRSSSDWGRHSDAGGSTPSILEQRMTMSSPGGSRAPVRNSLKDRLRERVLIGRSSPGFRLPALKEPERMSRSFLHENGEEYENDEPSFEVTKKPRAKPSTSRSVPPTVDTSFSAPLSVTSEKDDLSLRVYPSNDNNAPPPSPIKRKKNRLELVNAASIASKPESGDKYASPASSVKSIQTPVGKTVSPLSARHVASPPSPPRPRSIHHTSPASPIQKTRDLVSLQSSMSRSSRHSNATSPPVSPSQTSQRTRDLVSLESSRSRSSRNSNVTSPSACPNQSRPSPEAASTIQHSKGQVHDPHNDVGSPSIADRPDTPIQENHDSSTFGLGSKNSISKDEQSEAAASRRSATSQPQSPESQDSMGRNLNRSSAFDRRQSNTGPMRTNRVKLHIYDLIASEVVMPLPFWGCHFPIGSCFNALNNSLHQMGTGAYHVGIETHGIEYAYGANDSRNTTGIFTCMPKNSPGYQYRTTIDFGERPLIRKAYVRISGKESRYRSELLETPPNDREYQEVERHVDGREVLREMGREYLGTDYDLLRKNCCTFAHDACTRLGVQEGDIPSWFHNLAYAGAVTQDVAMATTRPLTTVLSACDCEVQECVAESGFEVFTDYQGKEQTQVVDFDSSSHASGIHPGNLINERSFTA